MRVLFGDNINKLLVADSAISVLIGILNHLLDFCLGEPLPDTFTDRGKLLHPEGACALLIEDFKQLFQGFLAVVIGTEPEDFQKGLELQFFVVGVGVDDLQDLSRLGLQTEGFNGVYQFLWGNAAAFVVVEDVETFLQFGDVVNREVLSGVQGGVEGGRLGGFYGLKFMMRGTARMGDFDILDLLDC